MSKSYSATPSHDQTTIEDAIKTYLKHNPKENKKSSMRRHRTRLQAFSNWCEDNEIFYMSDLSKETILDFKVYRREKVSQPSLSNNLDTIRVFLRHCARLEMVPPELSESVPRFEISPHEEVSQKTVQRTLAEEILNYLDEFCYATKEHVVWLILAETGLRISGLRAIDLEDYHGVGAGQYLDIVHRPESGTPLKKGMQSSGVNTERQLHISREMCTVLDDYITHKRANVTDGYERRPLVTTSYGRLSDSTIRSYSYKWTCPAFRQSRGMNTDKECDHEPHEYVKCTHKRSPHAIRKGYVQYLRSEGIPKSVVSDRVSTEIGVLEKHYDLRNKDERRKEREKVFKEYGLK